MAFIACRKQLETNKPHIYYTLIQLTHIMKTYAEEPLVGVYFECAYTVEMFVYALTNVVISLQNVLNIIWFRNEWENKNWIVLKIHSYLISFNYSKIFALVKQFVLFNFAFHCSIKMTNIFETKAKEQCISFGKVSINECMCEHSVWIKIPNKFSRFPF